MYSNMAQRGFDPVSVSMQSDSVLYIRSSSAGRFRPNLLSRTESVSPSFRLLSGFLVW